MFYRQLLWLAGVTASVSCSSAVEPKTSWIWNGSNVRSRQPIQFSRTFELAWQPTSVRLRFAPASARLTVLVDNVVVASAEAYSPIQSIELGRRLEVGTHTVTVRGEGVQGPSAFFLQLEMADGDGRRSRVVSDRSWRLGSGAPVDDLGTIDQRLVVPENQRVEIDVVDNYEQWKQALRSDDRSAKEWTDPASFFVAPDFEISLVRSAAASEGSWVSMIFDPEGRVIIAKEKRGLLRMTLSEDGRKVVGRELINDSLLECRGLAFVGEDLFANANNSKGLYRLPSAGDLFGAPELVLETRGGVGHGRNDLALGPDGSLYSIHGDAVDLPKEATDYTSPFRAAHRGEVTREGHLIRVDPQSGEVSLLTAGLRNPFGIDFNADGEVFTYDADAEYDMGSPWYRPTRVSHLVFGGDYGWRGVTKQWPSYYHDHPDNTRPNLDIGKGSPTAVKFGTRSSFPARYRDSLFVLDWAYGRVVAVHMLPRGSSYLMTGETFLKGRPLNVTDLDFAPDGSMYLVTGGRKTQSALYRVRYVGDDASGVNGISKAKPSWQLASERFARNSRLLRHELEDALLQDPSKRTLQRAWALLGNPDPWIRHAALNLIERHPIEMWKERALSESDVSKAVQGLTALARSGNAVSLPLVLRRLNELFPIATRAEDRMAALYSCWLCVGAIDELDESLRMETAEAFGTQYPSSVYSENRWLSELLVMLQAPDIVSKTIGLLASATEPSEQMHYLYILRNVSHGWSMEHRRAFFSGLAQSSQYPGGAGMGDFLSRIRAEAVETLGTEERESLAALIKAEAAVEETTVTEPRAFVRKWTVKELLESDGLHKGDAKRGAEVFASAACIKCHRFGTRGTLVGPDLSAASRRFSRRDLLVSIIEPSHVVAESYRSLQIVTTDGNLYVGQAMVSGDYRSPVLRLAVDPAKPSKTIEINKNDIESQKYSDVSWMPAGLMDTFAKEEILDLLAYLESSR